MSRQLVHYTPGAERVISILENGFLFIPNRRGLLVDLVETDDSWEREPQECGMVSFTELPTGASEGHRRAFGDFGLCVTWDWAVRNGVERVLYVRRDGPLFEAFRGLFTAAYHDVKRREEEGPISWGGGSIFNRAMAGMVGASAWHTMLRLYEFMQPDSDSAQVEWRLVNPEPLTFSTGDKDGQIKQALNLAKRWKLGSARVTPADIDFLMCPKDAERALRGQLPEGFRQLEIRSIE